MTGTTSFNTSVFECTKTKFNFPKMYMKYLVIYYAEEIACWVRKNHTRGIPFPKKIRSIVWIPPCMIIKHVQLNWTYCSLGNILRFVSDNISNFYAKTKRYHSYVYEIEVVLSGLNIYFHLIFQNEYRQIYKNSARWRKSIWNRSSAEKLRRYEYPKASQNDALHAKRADELYLPYL